MVAINRLILLLGVGLLFVMSPARGQCINCSVSPNGCGSQCPDGGQIVQWSCPKVPSSGCYGCCDREYYEGCSAQCGSSSYSCTCYDAFNNTYVHDVFTCSKC